MDAPSTCIACHSRLDSEARYCHRCGRAVTAGGAGETVPWIVAWAVVILAVAGIGYFVLTKDVAAARPDMANVGSGGATPAPGAPPDISQMTPEQRFQRLHDRIMTAAQQGDTASALRFAPMAVAAYGMLDRFDANLRYQAGAVMIIQKDYPAALALADSIQAEARDHLLGDMLRADAALASGDQATYQRARKAFLAHYDQQLASGRPEYQEHKAALDAFKNGK